MKHAIIVAHPALKSFTMSVANAYAEAARRYRHEVIVRDLYRIGFSPCLHEDELPGATDGKPHDDVALERSELSDAGVFAFIYPFWFNAPPAILKGYIDRVFGIGFGYAPTLGGTKSLLRDRTMIAFSSSGAPEHWVVNTGAYEANRRLSDEHVAAVCGMNFLDHVHFGGIVPGIRDEVVMQRLATVRSTVARYFGTVDA